MKRQLTITAAEWASIRTEGDPATFSATGGRMVRTLWLVARGNEHWLMAPDEPKLISATPPVEFVQACAPCETCGDQRIATSSGPGYFKGGRLHHLAGGQTVMEIRCPDCCIELVGPCPTCSDRAEWCGYGNGLPDDNPTCSSGTVTLGHAYAVGKPLPIVQFGSGHGTVGEYIVVVNAKVVRIKNDKFPVESKELTDQLAHAGPPEEQVGKWAIRLWVVPS